MPQFKNVMQVFDLLEKSNCRECNEKTCMAFAAAVFLGNKQLADCPHVSSELAANYGIQEKRSNDDDLARNIEQLKTKLRAIVFADQAATIGAVCNGGKLTLKIMGKDFSIDAQGKVSTDIHVNPWVLISTLNYIIHCKGLPVEEKWVPLRELPGGQDWYRLFGQQCEKPLKKLADTYPDLFEDLVRVFGGRQVANHYQSDVAVVLSPLPLVPLLICYWKPEDGMASNLNLFFDATAIDNMGMDGLYLLGTGITRMFEKLAQHHGFATN